MCWREDDVGVLVEVMAEAGSLQAPPTVSLTNQIRENMYIYIIYTHTYICIHMYTCIVHYKAQQFVQCQQTNFILRLSVKRVKAWPHTQAKKHLIVYLYTSLKSMYKLHCIRTSCEYIVIIHVSFWSSCLLPL